MCGFGAAIVHSNLTGSTPTSLTEAKHQALYFASCQMWIIKRVYEFLGFNKKNHPPMTIYEDNQPVINV